MADLTQLQIEEIYEGRSKMIHTFVYKPTSQDIHTHVLVKQSYETNVLFVTDSEGLEKQLVLTSDTDEVIDTIKKIDLACENKPDKFYLLSVRGDIVMEKDGMLKIKAFKLSFSRYDHLVKNYFLADDSRLSLKPVENIAYIHKVRLNSFCRGFFGDFPCEYCNHKFVSQKWLREHTILKHSGKHSCDACLRKDNINKFDTIEKLLAHQEKKHVKCVACDQFYDKKDYDESMLDNFYLNHCGACTVKRFRRAHPDR